MEWASNRTSSSNLILVVLRWEKETSGRKSPDRHALEDALAGWYGERARFTVCNIAEVLKYTVRDLYALRPR